MLRSRCQFSFLIATLLLLQAACLTNSQTSGSSQVAGRFRLERPNILADGNDLTQLTLLAYQRDSQKPIPGAAVTWLVKGCQSEQAEERTDAEGTARLTLKSQEPGVCTVEAQITVGEASLTLEQSATVLAYTMPRAGIVPGAQLKLQLAVADVAGFTDAGYTGQITLSSSDALATLPAAVNIAAADKGQVQLEVIFRTAGLQTLSAYDAQSGRMLFSQSFQVGFGSATQLALRDLPASIAAGSPLSGTVAVLDDFNNLVADFTGSVRLACQTQAQVDCTPADLPACTFAAADLGKKDCLSAWYLQRQGKSRLGVIALANPALQSPTVAIEVRPVGQPVLRALLPAAVRAGEATTLRLQATDAYGNVNPAYTGSVSFTSTDAQATLPAAVSFTAGDAGVKVLEGAAIFRSAGPQQLRLAASNAIASSTAVEVLVGAVRQVNARALSPNAALRPLEPEVSLSAADMQHQVAVPGAVQIWVSDTYGNRDRAFAGYVGLTACASANASSCPNPVFSANINFSPNDLGVKRATLPMQWQVSGSYSLIARVLGQVGDLSSHSNLQVISGPPASFRLTSTSSPNSPLEVVAGSETQITLTGFDLYGNLANGPTALNLSSNDANASLQAAIDVTAGAPLQLTLPATFRTAGSRTLTLQQRNSLGNLGEAGPLASLAISVLPAPAALVDLSLPSSAQAGDALAVTLAAKDLYGNLVPSFTGNVLLSSSDALATLPGTPLPSNTDQDRVLSRIAFAEGEGGIKYLPGAVLLRTAGSQQLNTWLEDSALRVSKAISVALGSSRFAQALPALPQGVSAVAGEPMPLRFLVADGYGNIDTQFSGTLAAYAVGQLNPIAAQLQPGDGGSVVVPNGFVFARAGNYSLRTEFAGSSSLAISPGFSTVRVSLNPQRTVRLQFLSEPVAGSPVDAEAWISDAYGNRDRSFTGTVNLSTSDANGSFPTAITFTGSDNGWKMLPQSFVFRTAGSQSLSLTPAASQPGVSSSTKTFAVAPAAPATVRHALVAGSLNLTQLLAGGAYDLELRVTDSYGNPITNQNTTVFLSCSDVNAQLPASVTLSPNDLGVRRLPAAVSLRQAGSQSLSSGLAPTADAFQTNYTVNASSQRYVYLTLLSPLVVANQPATIEVRIADAYRNVSTDFVGSIQLTGQGTPQFGSSTLTFAETDLGVKTTTVVFANSGNYTLSTNLPLDSELLGQSLSIAVQAPSAVRYLNLVASSNSLQAGQVGSVQLFVTKQAPTNPNLRMIDTSFTGSVTLSSSDPNASFFNQAQGQSFSYIFQGSDNGNVLLSNALRLRTAGQQTVVLSSTNPSIQSSTIPIDITPGGNRFANLNPIGPLQVGQPFSLQVYITDGYGNLATNCPNTTLALQSSDANAWLPGAIPLTSADQGNKLIPSAVTFYQSGAQSLTLNGNGITAGSASLNLAPGPIATTTLALSSQSPQTGQAITFQVNAFDSYSNLVTTANSNLQLTVSDAAASYPAVFALQSGTYSGSLMFRTTGPQSVSLTLPGSGAILNQTNVSVSLNSQRYAHAALGYTPSSIQTTAEAGALVPLLVWVGDAYGNVDASYSGTLTLQSSDALATLPATVSLSAANAGMRVLYGSSRFRTAGSVSLTASGAGLTSWPRSFTLAPGSQSFVYARPISDPNAGVPVHLRVWAADAYDNLLTSFTGNANLSCSDTLATLPATVSFNAASGGNMLLANAAVFRTAGSQSLTATAGISQRTQGFNVSLGAGRFAYAAAAAYGSRVASPQIATPYDLQIYVADSYGNVDASFTGTLQVQSSDANIQLASSGNYALLAPQAGFLSISNGVSFGSLGTQTLLANALGQAAIQASPSSYSVRSGAIARYALSVSNANAQAGQSLSVTVTAYDSYNNIATNAPTTALSLTCSDPNATVPATLTLEQGLGTFANAVTPRTSGAATLSLMPAGVVGGVSPLATVSINVLPASVAGVRILVPTTTYQGLETYDDTIVPNTLSDLVVGLQDAYGNVLTSYVGSLQITSNPSGLVASNLSAISYSKNDPNGMRFPQAVQMTFLGSGTITARESLSNVTGTYSLRSRQLAALGEGSSARHACAILHDGRTKCWGFNAGGMLGYGDWSNRGNSPGQMATNLPFLNLATSRQALAAALGFYHSCVLLDTGTLQCWGYNSAGELGFGDTSARLAPSNLLNVGSGRRAMSITAGSSHTCVVLDNKSTSCWGANSSGQLGLGDTANRTVSGLLLVFSTGRSVSKVVGENSSSCALLDTAQVTCWGHNSDGRLGLGDTISRTSPPQTPVALAVGRTVLDVSPAEANPCVLYDNRDMTCWGPSNYDGRLGLGDTVYRGSSASQMGANLPSVSLGTGRKALTLNYGGGASRFPLLDNRVLVSWGLNIYGGLGLGITGDRGMSPGHMGAGLLSVNLGRGHVPVRVSSGLWNGATCALLSSDNIKCWGGGADGAHGLGDTSNRGLLPFHMGDNLPVVPLLAATPWAPAYIGPLVWLDANSNESFLPANSMNANIRSWSSRASGPAYAAVQNSDGQMPKRVSGVLNGLPVVRFDGVDDHVGFGPSIDNSRTVAMVMRWNGWANYSTFLGGFSEQLWTGGSGDLWLSSVASVNVLNGSAFLGGQQLASPSALTRSLDWKIIILTTTTNTRIQNLGTDRYSSGRYFNGDLAELLVFDYVLSTTQRQILEGYLGNKWGLSSSLMAGHPYITAVPVFN